MGKKQHFVSNRVFNLIMGYLDEHPRTVDLTLVVGRQIMDCLIMEDGRDMSNNMDYCCGIPVIIHDSDPYHFWLENADGVIHVD